LSHKLSDLEYALSAAVEKIEKQDGLIQKLLDVQHSCSSEPEDAAESILVNLIKEQVFEGIRGEDISESLPEESSEDAGEPDDPVSEVIRKLEEEKTKVEKTKVEKTKVEKTKVEKIKVEETKVELWIYDLSGGLAKIASKAFLGFTVEAIYHTSAVLFGREYYFAAGKGDESSGISIIHPGTGSDDIFYQLSKYIGDAFSPFYSESRIRSSKLGDPIRKLPMGSTKISKAEFENFIQELGKSKYTSRKYSLLQHNCNHFTEDVMQKLVQKSIPQEIRDLPEKVLKTPFGKMINKKLKGLGP